MDRAAHQGAGLGQCPLDTHAPGKGAGVAGHPHFDRSECGPVADRNRRSSRRGVRLIVSENAENVLMIPTYSSWLEAHGKLWYDDKWYRLAWLISPQALMAVLVLLFWAASPSEKNLPWAKPVDPVLRDKQLAALRDSAKSDRQAMDKLEREARGGDMVAQFYYGTLFDPSIRFSTIVQPDVTQAVDWYARAAAQGNDSAQG